MADDNTIIEGHVKFRDNKKWKPRWCVLRKLSPVADCIQLELYREAGGARSGAAVAALALGGFVCAESGFTLERHSHTLAVLCDQLVVVLAFLARETLLQWQVKVGTHLGASRQFPVVVVGGALPAGAARLHMWGGAGGAGGARAAGVALVAGSPPALLASWPLRHLRRFGVYEGKFCIEGGALSGKEGLVAMKTERPFDLERELRAAVALEATTPQDLDSPRSHRRPDSRTSEIHTISRSLTSTDGLYADSWAADGAAAGADGADGGGALQRCVSCMWSLRAAPPPRAFRAAWTMRAVTRPPRALRALRPACPAPYDNYDVPRIPSEEVEGEYYDTPRRLRDELENYPTTVPRSVTTGDLLLRDRRACIRRVMTADSCRCEYRAAPDELYASVDLSQKWRRRRTGPAYENLEFALSLRHYENARELGARLPAPATLYLEMAPRVAGEEGEGYARMAPRAASNPALAEDAPPLRRRAASADSARDLPAELSSTETLRAAGGAGGAGGGVRRAAGNRDSSSSNDSGVCSWRAPPRRRARSSEPPPPLRAASTKSASAEAEVPVLSLDLRPRKGTADAHSTSSGTSDLSDYIETLSICSSHSSSDTPVTMRERGGCAGCAEGAGCAQGGCGGRGGRQCAAVLRPRSGAEYRRLLPAHTHTHAHNHVHAHTHTRAHVHQYAHAHSHTLPL